MRSYLTISLVVALLVGMLSIILRIGNTRNLGNLCKNKKKNLMVNLEMEMELEMEQWKKTLKLNLDVADFIFFRNDSRLFQYQLL